MNIQSSVFRIVQFTDLHLGERDDAAVLQLMRRVFRILRYSPAFEAVDKSAHRPNPRFFRESSLLPLLTYLRSSGAVPV